jgi:hypothetical protein
MGPRYLLPGATRGDSKPLPDFLLQEELRPGAEEGHRGYLNRDDHLGYRR